MAAGPKPIAEEFLRDARKALHALGYAPGCDYLGETSDWKYLETRYTEIIAKLEELLPRMPEGSVGDIVRRFTQGV